MFYILYISCLLFSRDSDLYVLVDLLTDQLHSSSWYKPVRECTLRIFHSAHLERVHSLVAQSYSTQYAHSKSAHCLTLRIWRVLTVLHPHIQRVSTVSLRTFKECAQSHFAYFKSAHSLTPHIRRVRTVSLRTFEECAESYSEHLLKMIVLLSHSSNEKLLQILLRYLNVYLNLFPPGLS